MDSYQKIIPIRPNMAPKIKKIEMALSNFICIYILISFLSALFILIKTDQKMERKTKSIPKIKFKVILIKNLSFNFFK